MEFSWISKHQNESATGNLLAIIKYFAIEKERLCNTIYIDFTNDCRFWCERQIKGELK